MELLRTSLLLGSMLLMLAACTSATPISTNQISQTNEEQNLVQLLDLLASKVQGIDEKDNTLSTNEGLLNSQDDKQMVNSQVNMEKRMRHKGKLKPRENGPRFTQGDIAQEKINIEEALAQAVLQNSDLEAEIEKLRRGRKWPGAVVPYEIDTEYYYPKEIEVILKAMKEIEEKTCIRFEEATEGDRLYINGDDEGCWSYVGKSKDKTVQSLNLEWDGCVHHGIVVHELGHALGFWHEQSRPDRDRYIMIHRKNIEKENRHNFDVERNNDYHGEPYNFGSVMHYEIDAFSRNDKPTISILDEVLYELQGEPELGDVNGTLTEIDARQINKHYGCYTPNSTPGVLTVRVPEAGPFEEPGHYYVCVRATDSNGRRKQKCSEQDKVLTTEPKWDEVFSFETKDPKAMFYFFEVAVLRSNPEGSDHRIVRRQSIWVECKDEKGSFYVTKSLCVQYEYKIE